MKEKELEMSLNLLKNKLSEMSSMINPYYLKPIENEREFYNYLLLQLGHLKEIEISNFIQGNLSYKEIKDFSADFLRICNEKSFTIILYSIHIINTVYQKELENKNSLNDDKIL